MNKKGFTLVELLAVIVLLGILAAIAVGFYGQYLTTSQQKMYSLEEKNFKNATYDAYLKYLAGTDKNLKDAFYELDTNKTTTIYLKDLVNNDYISGIKNPYNTNQLCDMEKSYITITDKDTQNKNKDFEYQICLICGDRKSSNCSEE